SSAWLTTRPISLKTLCTWWKGKSFVTGQSSGKNKYMSKQTILIIEDERALVEVLTYNLRKEGFDVHSATDGQDGLRRAQTTLPDLIVLDLMLPVIEGLEVCRVLKSGVRTRDIPLLMLAPRSQERSELVGFQMGADDYVTKPFKIKPLIQRVKALLRRKKVL